MRVVVVRSRFGGVLGEVAQGLAQAFGAPLHDADAADAPAADLAVLVGAGIEFDRALRGRWWRGRRPQVALWGFDPFPPPGLDQAEKARGERAGLRAGRARRLDSRLGHPFGGPGAGGRAKRWLRALTLRSRLSGQVQTHDLQTTVDPRLAVVTFERLLAVRAAVSRGAIDHVLVSSPASVRTLAEYGVHAHYEPVPRHDGFGARRDQVRDLPVLFVGMSRDRRGDRLRALAASLEGRGIPLTIVDRGLYGEARTALLNRARILVNLHKYPWHFERIRFSLAAANGALLVSEGPIADPAPMEPGVHLVAAPTTELPAVIESLLQAPARIEALAQQAAALYAAQDGFDAVARRLTALAGAAGAVR